jgi:hypothetical protein
MNLSEGWIEFASRLFCWPHWLLPDQLRALLGETPAAKLGIPGTAPLCGHLFSVFVNGLLLIACFSLYRAWRDGNRFRAMGLLFAGVLPAAALLGSAEWRRSDLNRGPQIVLGSEHARLVPLGSFTTRVEDAGPGETEIPAVLEVRRDAPAELLFSYGTFRGLRAIEARAVSLSDKDKPREISEDRWRESAPLQIYQAMTPVPDSVAKSAKLLEAAKAAPGERLLAAAMSPNSDFVALAWTLPSPIEPARKPGPRIRLEIRRVDTDRAVAIADLPSQSVLLCDGHWREGGYFLLPLRDRLNTLLIVSPQIPIR